MIIFQSTRQGLKTIHRHNIGNWITIDQVTRWYDQGISTICTDGKYVQNEKEDFKNA